MSDLLLVLVIIWAVVVLHRHSSQPRQPSPRRPAAVRRRPRTGGLVVACHHCGLFVPDSESITGADGQRYCSRDHATRH